MIAAILVDFKYKCMVLYALAMGMSRVVAGGVQGMKITLKIEFLTAAALGRLGAGKEWDDHGKVDLRFDPDGWPDLVP